MPKNNEIKSILIIGAGPIIIGQACEFDYSGAQACKALKEEGYRVVLINSNPATIMTDPQMADKTYIEPITAKIVEKILIKEKIDAVLPTMGGQTALNIAMELHKNGIFEKLGITVLGARPEVIEKAEDRQKFREAMEKIGLECPKSQLCSDMESASKALEYVGLPCIIRPSFTLGGQGGGAAYNSEEFREIVAKGMAASPVGQVLVEESVLGWKEFEMEVIRDKSDNCIIICSIENIDPMGVHTGDSITVAPALTLTDKEYQQMRNASFKVLREIGVETGGSNVQFAVNPENGRMVVIEMNPRVSRSSALASKATGFPIAKVAAKLAVGYTLDEITNDITGSTPASFEPTIDYIVTKAPRFTFEKFPETEQILGTSMKSVGEAMAIGRSFKESIQKVFRSLETGLTGLNEIEIDTGDRTKKDKIIFELAIPRPNRLLYVADAFRLGVSLEDIYKRTKIDKWFLREIKEIIETEEILRKKGVPDNKIELKNLKIMGFSDARISELTGVSERKIRSLRHKFGIHPVYKNIDTCAGEFSAKTNYMYSAYEFLKGEDEAPATNRNKVIILGGGPNRIGQGIEFDYCCCHACFAMKELGIESIMINCNPETVSTDYDTSDRLYFEPLTAEDVLEIIKKEQENGTLLGVIVQFGGQTPLKLSQILEEENIPILGTSPDSIDLAEDRERFKDLIHRLKIKQPDNGIVWGKNEAIKIANKIGYPVLIRPSYVLGGRAMKIVFNDEALLKYMEDAAIVSDDNPVLIDRYLQNADEVDLDLICDGKDVYIAGIMQHIEEAGVHSGDSSCSLPPFSLSKTILDKMKSQSKAIAIALKVKGLMNVQYAVCDNEVYILEVNPRASRTIPFVAKTTGVPIAKIAAKVMSGEKLSSFNLKSYEELDYISLKSVVFPFNRFLGSDVILGPEMKSTGEVMGIDKDFGTAFAKTQIAAGIKLPLKGEIFVSVRDIDKPSILPIIKEVQSLGFDICATNGTATYLSEKGIKNIRAVNKVSQGRPHCVDEMISGKISLAFMTTGRSIHKITDGYLIRQTTLLRNIPNYTTISAMKAFVQAVKSLKKEDLQVKSIQEYYQ